jgi:uncharacterized protein involved in response to NO
MRRFAAHPLWLAGFRPFFALACLAGMFLPLAWALFYSGLLPAPAGPFTPAQWHAHEMFFGFGWAVLGGFLLTATKNWVSVRGWHGAALAWLACAWLVERLGMALGGNWPPPLFLLSNNLFLGSIIAMLMWTLLRHHAQDSYRDNGFFLLVLPAFLVAKTLLLHGEHFAAGHGMALALFRMAFLVMMERTLTQFMRGNFQVDILRRPLLDNAIKLLGLLLVIEFVLAPGLAAAAALLLALVLAARFLFWKPMLALRRIDIGIMYIGYLLIVVQLVVQALGRLEAPAWTGSVSVHLFSFGVMGTVIPAMLVRISKGHTGRKVTFDALDRAVLYLMLVALALRVVAPQLLPAAYLLWLQLAAACWFACFGILGWRYIPFLLRPRVDGKEH